MSLFLLLMFNLMNASFLLFSTHPLSMMLIIINQTLLISLISGMKIFSFWFSYILFLIFIGGMLILFIYISSLASNDMFNFSKNYLFLTIFWIIFFIFMFISTLDLSMMLTNMNNEILKSFSYFFLSENNNLIINKIYNNPMNLISILLMLFLFYTLIAIVKITNLFEGPLRPKF